MLGHEAAARVLADHGVDTVFGLVGDGNIYLVKSLIERCGVRYVAAAHEASATSMADGYARVTGRLGVASVTHGPGLTNTLTALTEAGRNETSMLLVCGDTPTSIAAHPQDIDQKAIVLPTGAGFEHVRSSATLVRDISAAIRRAHVERRPIVVNIPVEFGAQETGDGGGPVTPFRQQAIAPDPAVLDDAVGLVASSNRPLILAGRGAASPRSRTLLLRLSDALRAPLATTLLAKDLFAGEARNVGIFGSLSSDATLDVITRADASSRSGPVSPGSPPTAGRCSPGSASSIARSMPIVSVGGRMWTWGSSATRRRRPRPSSLARGARPRRGRVGVHCGARRRRRTGGTRRCRRVDRRDRLGRPAARRPPATRSHAGLRHRAVLVRRHQSAVRAGA